MPNLRSPYGWAAVRRGGSGPWVVYKRDMLEYIDCVPVFPTRHKAQEFVATMKALPCGGCRGCQACYDKYTDALCQFSDMPRASSFKEALDSSL